MFAKLSIRTKLIGVVAFLLLSITGMGLLAVRNMKALNASTVDIAKNWLPSVRALGDLRAGAITYRNMVREHMLAETLEEKLAAEKMLENLVASDDKIRAAYEPLITSPQERALYNDWVRTWQDYRKGVDQVLALSRKEAGQAPHDAHVLNTNTVNKVSIAADEILRKNIDLSNAGRREGDP
jgi:methyl-accepting chemotaxis protein